MITARVMTLRTYWYRHDLLYVLVHGIVIVWAQIGTYSNQVADSSCACISAQVHQF
jgi:hypothetical protein